MVPFLSILVTDKLLIIYEIKSLRGWPLPLSHINLIFNIEYTDRTLCRRSFYKSCSTIYKGTDIHRFSLV